MQTDNFLVFFSHVSLDEFLLAGPCMLEISLPKNRLVLMIMNYRNIVENIIRI